MGRMGVGGVDALGFGGSRVRLERRRGGGTAGGMGQRVH